MPIRFLDRVVLVTGGGSGIGRATARAFAREGATVVVAGRRREPLDETVTLITADGGHTDQVTADLTRPDDAARLVDTIVRRHGALHIAVNNAGLARPGTVADLSFDDWSELLATNLTGVWTAMKHEIAHMREHGAGVIVNTSANLGAHLSNPALGAYGATKAAVTALSRAAARAHIADGIRINTVSPGPMDTSMSLRPGETEAERADRMTDALPIGRVGSLDEVAATVLWLASPESGFAVGHDLVIDGGASA